MSFSDILSGNIIYADDIYGLAPISAQKGAAESRTSTTVQTVDSALVLSLPASTTWDFDLLLFLSSNANAAGDWAGHLEWPANATCSYGGMSLVDTLASGSSADAQAGPTTRLDAASPGSTLVFGTSTTGSIALIRGRIALGVTAGNLSLFWAQNSSNATPSFVLEGSTFTARRAA